MTSIQPTYPTGTYVFDVSEGQSLYPDGFHFNWDDELDAVDGIHVFRGYSFRKTIDPRWLMDFPEVEKLPFNAEIVEGVDNEVMVGFPACDYDHYKNVDCFPNDKISSKCKKDMDYKANEFDDKSTALRKRHVVFRIQPRCDVKHPKISVREIYLNRELGKELELETKIFPVKSKHKDMKMKNVAWYVQWTFVVKDGDEKPRKTGKPDPTPKISDAAAMVAAQMNVYDSDDEDLPDYQAS